MQEESEKSKSLAPWRPESYFTGSQIVLKQTGGLNEA
jgi:hypothetical protein